MECAVDRRSSPSRDATVTDVTIGVQRNNESNSSIIHEDSAHHGGRDGAADRLARALTITGMVSASPRDRLSAMDLAAKYGLGTKDEISVVSEDVVVRLEAQATRFVAELPAEALAIVKRICDEVWQ